MAPIASMTVRLSAQIAEFQSEFKSARKTVEDFAGNFEGIATRAAAVGAFIGTIAAGIAGSLARAFGDSLRDAVRLSSEFSNAFIGLASVARAFGTDADLARDAARRLSADGLLPLRDSAAGLKNLLAAGFNLAESTQLMNAFRDSAAFGRAGALSFGDAVRTATEGVKNGNSILVDNAGITKNLSNILKEAGYSAQDLGRATSDAGVRQALLNGILREAGAFAGDAARLTQTYTGTLTAMQTQWTNLLATWGDAVTQNRVVQEALRFVGEQFGRLTGALQNNSLGYNLVSTAVIAFVRVLAAGVRGIDLMQQAFNIIDSALVGTVKAFADAAKGIADIVLSIAIFASKLPGSTLAMSGFRDEIGSVIGVSVELGREATQLGTRLRENDARTKAWSSTLGGFARRLDDLVPTLEAARGKTVEFGEAGTRAGVALTNGLEGGARRADAAIQKVIASVASFRIGLQSLPGIRIDLSNLIPPNLPNIGKIKDGLSTLPGERMPIPVAPELMVRPFRDAFTAFGRELPGIILGAIQGGGSISRAIVSGLSVQFTRASDEIAARIRKNLADGIKDGFSGAEKAVGVAGVGLSSALAGYDFGKSLGRGKGALAGAAAGAIAGAPLAGVTAGLSVAIGAIAGGLAGLFGGAAKAKQSLAELRAAQADVLQKSGGLEAITRQAESLGISLGNAFTTRRASEFTQVMERLNEAIEAQKRRFEGLQIAIDGVNAKAEGFARPFRALLEAREGLRGRADADPLQLDALNAKIAETAQRGQAEFERLGLFVGATFAGIVNESGNALGAITSLAPAFGVLQQGVNEFGLTTSGTISELLSMFSLVNDQTTGPIIQSIQNTGQIFAGLQQAGYMTANLFQTVGDDIGASFRDLEAKGGDVARAMALSQPVLQRLWEAQQRYGNVADETTQALLRQAQEQGLVGNSMRDVNERILDVLLAIADVFGARLPAAFRTTTDAARDAARGIQREFDGIRIRPVRVPIIYDRPDFAGEAVAGARGETAGAPAFAGTAIETNVYLDGDLLANNTARRMPGILALNGVG